MKLSYQSRKAMYGRWFVSIWVLGVLLFFVTPFFKTLFFSFNTLRLDGAEGMRTEFAGLTHYLRMVNQDAEFLPKLSNGFLDLLYETPIITAFSLFVSIVLNRQFGGRLFFRSVFFLPVIVMSGVVISLIKGNSGAGSLLDQTQPTEFFAQITVINDLLGSFNFGTDVVKVVTEIVSRVIDTVWKSGVQIVLFLAGLQSISGHLYEAAKIEGATKWEEFWKITFPLISPVMIIAIIYTIIDSFTYFDNLIMNYINTVSFVKFEYSYGSAISMVYCLIIIVFIGIVTFLLRRVTGDRS